MGKANADAAVAAGKTFSENTVAIILMSLGTTSITLAQYDMMSALDGQKTASSFQHQFRSVLQKAKELKQRVEDGETFAAVTPSKKRAAGDVLTPPTTPKKAKATPKPRAKKSKAKVAEDDNSPTNDLGSGNGSADGTNGIKQEQAWEMEI